MLHFTITGLFLIAYNYMLNDLVPVAIFSVLGLSALQSQAISPSVNVLAARTMSLETRYADAQVNEVFKDNILLTLAYLDGQVKSAKDIDWEKLHKKGEAEIVLKKGEVFAFHEDALSDYSGHIAVTTHAHFNSGEGFKSDGWLVGDGVCHFASLLYWVAKDAGLEAKAPTNHDFANIPEVPKEYGVSIFYMPGQKDTSENQNLYIKNTKDKDIRFAFKYDGVNLKIDASEIN